MKKYIIKIIGFGVGVVHITVSYFSGLLYQCSNITLKLADQICNAEGLVVEKIDNTCDRQEIAMLRHEKTSNLFGWIAQQLEKMAMFFKKDKPKNTIIILKEPIEWAS